MLFRIFINCFLISLFSVCYCEEQWQIEEKEIFLSAMEENVPIVAVFLGGEWCPWSKKLREDVLKNPLFTSKVEKEALFWEISLEKEFQDDAMRQKYNIVECPQILLLDPHGKEFARFGYLPLQASAYGDEIVSFIEDFNEICTALDQKENGFDEARWKDLYLKAKKLSAPCYSQVILERSLKKEKGTFFHLEKYAALLQTLKIKNPAVRKMKTQLLAKDPNAHFKVAVLEFQKLAAKSKSKEKAIKPLTRYVHLCGKKDPENLWRAELMIAEYLYSRKLLPQALEHAQASYEVAPESAKAQIAQNIAHMQGN